MEISFKKYLLSAAIGFGIGGAIWGGILYSWIPDIDYPLNIVGILVGLFGGIGLSIFSKNIKQILKVSGFGLLGSMIGFIVAFFGIYHLGILGRVPYISPWFLFFSSYAWDELTILEPHLSTSDYWLNFALAGIFIGLFLAIAFKIKIWSLVWRGGVGFGLGALVGPVIGNLIGNLFNSLLVSYLITFSVIGIVLGLFLAWGIYVNSKNQKSKIKITN